MFNVIIFTDTTDNIVSIPAIGPYKCAHVLRKSGYSCLVVNHLCEFSFEEITDLLDIALGAETFLIGFSTTFLRSTQIERDPHRPTPPYPELGPETVFPQGKEFENQVFDYVRKCYPNIKTVAGGTKTNFNFTNKNIDYVCLGYSEASIINLANHISKGETLHQAQKNIWGITVIDDRFAPSYEFANEDMVWTDVDVVNHMCLPIEIGRGCVFKCKFCSFPMNGKQTLDFVKSAKMLQKELQYNYDHFGTTHYQIVDDTFNDHQEKLDMIHDVIKKLTFSPKFWAYSRLDLLHTRQNTIQQLHDIGLRGFFFGIESLNPKSARFVGKGYDFSKSVETIKHIRNNFKDISMHGSFIVGLPYETVDQVTATFNRLLSQDIPLHSWKFYPLMIEETSGCSFPSDIAKNYQSYGYTKIGNISPVFVNWKSDLMTWQQANDLADKFMTLSRQSENFKLESSLAFPLTTMGYKLEELVGTPFKDFNFNDCEYNVRPAFIRQYKEKLFSLIRNKNNISIVPTLA
jgi:hypothetical protein